MSVNFCRDRHLTVLLLHGYNTEQIVSFDKQHNELITNEYLFRRKCLNDIKQLILETALRDEKLSRWETIDSMNDVKEHFMQEFFVYRLQTRLLTRLGLRI